jgi:hypothetical protein
MDAWKTALEFSARTRVDGRQNTATTRSALRVYVRDMRSKATARKILLLLQARGLRRRRGSRAHGNARTLLRSAFEPFGAPAHIIGKLRVGTRSAGAGSLDESKPAGRLADAAFLDCRFACLRRSSGNQLNIRQQLMNACVAHTFRF